MLSRSNSPNFVIFLNTGQTFKLSQLENGYTKWSRFKILCNKNMKISVYDYSILLLINMISLCSTRRMKKTSNRTNRTCMFARNICSTMVFVMNSQNPLWEICCLVGKSSNTIPHITAVPAADWRPSFVWNNSPRCSIPCFRSWNARCTLTAART